MTDTTVNKPSRRSRQSEVVKQLVNTSATAMLATAAKNDTTPIVKVNASTPEALALALSAPATAAAAAKAATTAKTPAAAPTPAPAAPTPAPSPVTNVLDALRTGQPLPADPVAAAVASVAPASAPPVQAPTAAPSAQPDAGVDPLLLTILGFRRKHESPGDHSFRTWLIATLKHNGHAARISAPGNIIVTTDVKSTTMFSCHIDTCHNGKDSIKQKLNYDPGFGHLFLDEEDKDGGCLGADDGAGIYLMLRMLFNKVPGTYVFHVGEERGGIGSRALLAKEPEFIAKFDRAIAFDRAGTEDVVYVQGGADCASLLTANWFCGALNRFNLTYSPSTKGSFTDTKVYKDVIPECFNISVGYYDQHGPTEHLDVGHLENLLHALLQIKWETMPTNRKIPPAHVYPSNGAYQGSGYGYDNQGAYGNAGYGRNYSQHALDLELDDEHLDTGAEMRRARVAQEARNDEARRRANAPAAAPAAAPTGKVFELRQPAVTGVHFIDELQAHNYDDMREWAQDNPEHAADAIFLLLAKVSGLKAECAIYEKMLGT